MILRRSVAAGVVAALLAGAIPAPLTAHSAQDVAAPAPQPAVYVPQDVDERGLWMQSDEEERRLRNSNFVIQDPALNAYVRDVFCRTVGPDCNSIRLYLVRTPYFNATSAPNGMVQVWSGLFLRVRNEAQLAAVLAHEYAHYRDRHVLQLWRQLKSKSGSATFFAMFGLIGSMIAIGQLASVFSFSREQEASADSEAVRMLAAAGYNPMAASEVWTQIRAEADATAAARKTKSRKDKNGGMFATHPTTAERVQALVALAGKTPVTGTASLRDREYRTALRALWPSFIDDQIKMNDFGASEYLLGYLANDGWTPTLQYARGELYRFRGRADDLKAAARFYQEATAGTGADVVPEAWRGLGLSLLRSGSPSEAKVALDTYLKLKPDASDRAMIAMLAGGTN